MRVNVVEAAEAVRLGEAPSEALAGPERVRVEGRVEELRALLSRGPDRIGERQADWLGGSA